MCGICGMLVSGGAAIDREVLSRMTAAIRHRGPDGTGQYIDAVIGLGHRRLSIIDIDGGKQPMANASGEIQVVFNGEIYNFIELRADLEKAGYRFVTRSDTEVIVHAYEEWGIDCLKRFNGMFALALWDSRNRKLLLARDHLGIKPLYYVDLGNIFLFASEIKALLEHPACPREVDLDSLAELFTFRYVPSPKTLFRGIMKLPPAHLMVLTQSGHHTERFWNWIPCERQNVDETQLIEEYRALLEDAVKLQLRSDVPIGLFLSSGVDSSLLLAIASGHTKGPMQSFTIGFDGGEKSNEVDDARKLALAFGAEHYAETLGPADYLRYFDRYMSDIEEPVGNETAAAFYFVARVASRHVKVALTGQGADEPWAGYDRHKGAKLADYYRRMPGAVTRYLGPMIARVPGRMERLKRGAASLGEPDALTRLAKIYSYFSVEMKERLYKGPIRSGFESDPFAPRHALGPLQADVKHLASLSQMLYIDTRANLPDDLLMVGDKTSMANSLECRVPYLDYRLVEFVESLPLALRLKGLTGKYLHKKAAERWLPKADIYRKKKGFANPIETWLRTSMKPFVEECLLSANSSMAIYFDQKYIAQMLKLDLDGKEQYRRHIYLLMSLELWHRNFIGH